MPADLESKMTAAWEKIDHHDRQLVEVRVAHAVMESRIAHQDEAITSMRDVMKEQHGALMNAVNTINLHLAKSEGAKSGRKEFGAGAVTLIGLACTVVGVIAAVATIGA